MYRLGHATSCDNSSHQNLASITIRIIVRLIDITTSIDRGYVAIRTGVCPIKECVRQAHKGAHSMAGHHRVDETTSNRHRGGDNSRTDL